MKKFTVLSILSSCALFLLGAGTSNAASYMENGTVDYPYSFYSSFAPSSVSVVWDGQVISLVDPQTDDFGDDYVEALVKLGEGEWQSVNAYLMTSFGNPEDPEDKDLYMLDVALYDLEDLWAFDGNTVSLLIPEGIVKNMDDEINPSQEFVFYILPTCTDYSITPDSGSTLSDDFTVTVSFEGKKIEYLSGTVRAMIYDPEYKDIALELDKEVTITDNNELVLNLSSLESGEYEVVIPEAYVFVFDGDEKYLSPDLWLEFTVENSGNSGVRITGITTAEGVVYDLNGRKAGMVSEGGNYDKLSEGIYIVNGKKVLIRK